MIVRVCAVDVADKKPRRDDFQVLVNGQVVVTQVPESYARRVADDIVRTGTIPGVPIHTCNSRVCWDNHRCDRKACGKHPECPRCTHEPNGWNGGCRSGCPAAAPHYTGLFPAAETATGR